MILGIDFSTITVDAVLLHEDGDPATANHHRRRLDTGPGKALERIRRIADAMPARGQWRDAGVTLVAIEKPYSRQGRGSDSIQYALGAILATIPPDVELQLIRADDWRRACQLPVRAPRDRHKRNAVEFAAAHWLDVPAVLHEDAADAFCIAWAARSLHDQP